MRYWEPNQNAFVLEIPILYYTLLHLILMGKFNINEKKLFDWPYIHCVYDLLFTMCLIKCVTNANPTHSFVMRRTQNSYSLEHEHN